jgi:hypothetical protein
LRLAALEYRSPEVSGERNSDSFYRLFTLCSSRPSNLNNSGLSFMSGLNASANGRWSSFSRAEGVK